MRNRGAIIILIFLAVNALVLSFIPPVQQLGSWIRLIIFHGILSIAGLYTIYAAGILGVLYLVLGNKGFGRWSGELGLISVVVWLVGTLLSFVSMQVAWGGLMWTEPRTIAAVTIVVLGLGKEYLVRSGGGKIKTFAMANLGFAAAVLLIRQTLEFVMHPDNPIGTSDSAVIRLLPMVMLGFTLLAIAQFCRWRLAQRIN
ncbi:MAG: hypothetical protein SCK29_01895 [Bacillota bacterium]|nr:hypothetical protein [Bacillota bacterium]